MICAWARVEDAASTFGKLYLTVDQMVKQQFTAGKNIINHMYRRFIQLYMYSLLLHIYSLEFPTFGPLTKPTNQMDLDKWIFRQKNGWFCGYVVFHSINKRHEFTHISVTLFGVRLTRCFFRLNSWFNAITGKNSSGLLNAEKLDYFILRSCFIHRWKSRIKLTRQRKYTEKCFKIRASILNHK